jgi:lipoprotein-releasing system permease protein
LYKLFIAFRYLLKRRIVIFPISGVALGVMALIVVISIMQGFETDFRSRIRGISSDMTLSFRMEDGYSGDTEEFLAALEKIDGIRAVSPRVTSLGFAKVRAPSADNPLEVYVYEGYVEIKGFDFERESRVVDLKDHLQHGKDLFAEHPFDQSGDTRPVFIIGSRFAGKREGGVRTKETDWGNVTCGAKVQLATFTPGLEVRRSVGAIADVVSSGIYEIDSHTMYMPLDWARELKDLDRDAVTSVGIALDEYSRENVTKTKDAIKALMKERAPYMPFVVSSWEEERKTFLTAVAMERRIMAFILFFFLVVAGFSISAILAMIVLEKVRDIGILRAMGASARGTAAIFIVYSVLIAMVGSTLGLVGGVAFVKNVDYIEAAVYNATGWQPFPPELYDLPEIPRQLDWTTNLMTVAAALLVSFAAGVIPALRAAWLLPVEAIRHE